MKKILMLVNWDVYRKNTIDKVMQSPNILSSDKRYWFFKYWLDDIKVDVIDYSKIPVLHIFEKKIFRFYVTQALKSVSRLQAYDVIISHGAQSAVLLAFIRSILGRKEPPHIIIDVGCLNGGRSRQPELLLFQQAMKSVSGIIYHASAQQQHYEKHFAFLSGKTAFVPFGVDRDFFKPLNVPSEDYILSFGYKFRDWETLIAAYSGIKTDVKLKIIGTTKISSKVKNVISRPVVPINELKEQIARSKFVVLPLVDLPYAHGQMTLLQSMAMGKAVIVTRVAGTSDYIVNGENGLLTKLFDADDMKTKIEYLLENNTEVERLQINARASIEQRFNEQSMAESIYNALQKFGVV
jgi:glycosyltransferase involved in cell wall biosynthesis